MTQVYLFEGELMCYNLPRLDEQKHQGALNSKAACSPHNLIIVGKAPSMCGHNVLAVRLGNGSAHGGRFAMGRNRRKVKRICLVCGKEFPAWASRDRQICSDKCKHKYKYRSAPKEVKICVTCGKEFTPAHGGIKTCSEECKRESIRRRPSSIANGYRQEPLSPINCAYCGVEFTPKQFNQKCCCEKHGNALRESHKSRSERVKKYIYICKFCGKEYFTHRKECDQYCSREHSDLHRKQISERKKQQELANRKIICPECNKEFLRKHGGQKFCSSNCARKYYLNRLADKRIVNHQKNAYVCKECGDSFVPSFGNKHRSYCSDGCRNRRMGRIAKATRKARIRGAEKREAIDPIVVFERAKWHCQNVFCGVSTPRELRGTIDDHAPEMDHIIPIAGGGTHTWDNVQCLCRKCNQEKGASIGDWFSLVREDNAIIIVTHTPKTNKISGSAERAGPAGGDFIS